MKRYNRHLIIPEIGEAGQRKINSSKVLVIGIGGLGSSAIIHLVANGIGKIGIVDYDKVDITNLHRQILHMTTDIGKEKTNSAKEKIYKINPLVNVELYNQKLTIQNAEEIIDKYNFIIEATDNIKSKILINDICVKLKKPFSYAGINKFFGSTITVIPGKSACLRCIFQNIGDSDGNISGVFGPVPGILGTIQASEAIKFVGEFGELLTDRILFVDVFHFNFRLTKVGRSKNCICK